MAKEKILMVYNDHDLWQTLRCRLEDLRIETYSTHDLDNAIQIFAHENICLFIIDAALSATDRHRLLKIMRTVKAVPILLLSNQYSTADQIAALEAGATVYVQFSYQVEECVAQAKSLIAFYYDVKINTLETHALAYGTHLIINPSKRQVFVNEAPASLTRKEFDLLLCLARHPGHVFTREQLYQQVWGTNYSYNVDDVVKTHIKTLRKKLSETEQGHIQNVWGVGYRFEPK